MAQKFKSTERFLKPDPRYRSMQVSKFINCLMRRGKRSIAENIFYAALDGLDGKIEGKAPIEIFETAIKNVKPIVEVRSKRVGGATYQVPREVNPKRQQSLAFRWILNAARERKGRPMHQRLSDEFLAAYNQQGAAITHKENTHRMAEANKAFAHFAW